MNSKRSSNNELSNKPLNKQLNEENDDPNPNIINVTELNLDLLPKLKKIKKSQTKSICKVDSVPKSCDRTKAKELVAEQQRKRFLEVKAARNMTSKVQKDEIKKRLEALHKNSLKIVKKNVEKKRKELVVENSTGNVDEGEKSRICFDFYRLYRFIVILLI